MSFRFAADRKSNRRAVATTEDAKGSLQYANIFRVPLASDRKEIQHQSYVPNESRRVRRPKPSLAQYPL